MVSKTYASRFRNLCLCPFIPNPRITSVARSVSEQSISKICQLNTNVTVLILYLISFCNKMSFEWNNYMKWSWDISKKFRSKAYNSHVAILVSNIHIMC